MCRPPIGSKGKKQIRSTFPTISTHHAPPAPRKGNLKKNRHSTTSFQSRASLLSARGASSGTKFPCATRFAQVDDPLAAQARRGDRRGREACAGWMRRQRGGGGRRGPTCLYAPLRARPMPTPPPTPGAHCHFHWLTPARDARIVMRRLPRPRGPRARPRRARSRCLAWAAAPLQVGPRAAALPLRPSPFSLGFWDI